MRSKMKAVAFNNGNFGIFDVDVPTLKPGFVLVKVLFSSINWIDIYHAERLVIPSDHADNFILGYEFIGVVVASDEKDVNIGDRIWGFRSGSQGGWAEYISLTVGAYHVLSSETDAISLLSIGLTGVTAWLALVEYARASSSDILMVDGASGHVGEMLLKMAHIIGLRAIAVTGDIGSIGQCYEFGGDDVILRKQLSSHWNSKLGKPTIYISTGRDHNLSLAIELLELRGRIIVLSGRRSMELLPIGDLYVKGVSILGFTLDNSSFSSNCNAMKYIENSLLNGVLQSRSTRVLPLDYFRDGIDLQKADSTSNEQSSPVNTRVILDVAQCIY